ncbi:MAG: sigma-70 family RNA polymerase sigma factor [Lachnospiraceae bacterium]|nr:sigma-70 family RNA polymerase sigma factor [Lachnospiraceae bacterium]
MKDDEIIDLYWERKETAIAATAEKYGKYCHSISYNILHDNEDAEECVNDTWLGAWKSMPPQRPERLSAYLGKITRNLSLNQLKQYAAEKRGLGQAEAALSELEDCIPAETGVEQAIDEMVLAESINQFLREQPEQKRNIFIRRYWYLCPIRDIAENYGMSESKVTSLLFRMRNKLKAHLEKEGIAL